MPVNGPRHKLFACAALAADQNRSRSWRNLGDQLGNRLHLGIVADDEFAFRARLQFAQNQLILVFERLAAIASLDHFPHEPRRVTTQNFHVLGLHVVDLPCYIGITSYVDDEISCMRAYQLPVVAADWQAEFFGEYRSRGQWILVRDANNFDSAVLMEQLQQRRPAFTRTDEDDSCHSSGFTVWRGYSYPRSHIAQLHGRRDPDEASRGVPVREQAANRTRRNGLSYAAAALYLPPSLPSPGQHQTDDGRQRPQVPPSQKRVQNFVAGELRGPKRQPVVGASIDCVLHRR